MNNKYILLLKTAKYFLAIYALFISIIIVIISIFYFKVYDVYQTRGYISCEDKCRIILSIDTLNISKLSKGNYVRINKGNLNILSIDISDIKVDENTKSNYQIVTYEVDKLDDVNNTFQDVKIYSNNEIIFKKLLNILGGRT